MTSILTDSNAMSSVLPARSPTLSVRNLTKRFQHTTVVHDIDLDLFPGEIYGLIGPNGAGKTTLMSMMVGAEVPTLGEVLIEGEPFRHDRNLPRLQRCIGFLPDDYPLYDDLTVWQCLEYLLFADESAAGAAGFGR